MTQTTLQRRARADRRDARIQEQQKADQAMMLQRIANQLTASARKAAAGTPINVVCGCKRAPSLPIPGSRQSFHFFKNKRSPGGVKPIPVTITRGMRADIAKSIRNDERRKEAGRKVYGPELY